jgi:glucosamine-6-phosphate deaminase
MKLRIFPTSQELARAAAQHAAESLRRLLHEQTTVRLLAATGTSQIEFLQHLTAQPHIDWTRLELFHMAEYLAIAPDHPASFARYIKERIIEPTGIERYHLLDGTPDGISDVSREITAAPIDLAFTGIGENGHLAFNDPPADFDTEAPYLVVDLDQACRWQQVGEGWFASIDNVPRQAVTISIRQLLRSKEILSIVPDARKARAVKACLERPVSPSAPASALRLHPDTTIFLDAGSSSLLTALS